MLEMHIEGREPVVMHFNIQHAIDRMFTEEERLNMRETVKKLKKVESKDEVEPKKKKKVKKKKNKTKANSKTDSDS